LWINEGNGWRLLCDWKYGELLIIQSLWSQNVNKIFTSRPPIFSIQTFFVYFNCISWQLGFVFINYAIP
jgi:hypothetical protein